jgi:hypothetical protein
VQLALSVAVTVYVPADKLDCAALTKFPGVQLYVYGAVPPEADTLTLPFVPPLQETFVWAAFVNVIVGQGFVLHATKFAIVKVVEVPELSVT